MMHHKNIQVIPRVYHVYTNKKTLLERVVRVPSRANNSRDSVHFPLAPVLDQEPLGEIVGHHDLALAREPHPEGEVLGDRKRPLELEHDRHSARRLSEGFAAHPLVHREHHYLHFTDVVDRNLEEHVRMLRMRNDLVAIFHVDPSHRWGHRR